MHGSCITAPQAANHEPAEYLEYYKRLLPEWCWTERGPELKRPGAGQNQRPELISTSRGSGVPLARHYDNNITYFPP